MEYLLPLIYIVLSCLVIWRSSNGFELASDYLGRKFPPGIKGATINAIASSMPEFLTTIFFLFYLRDADGFSGGLGVSSGSALFNLLIIPALAIIMLYSLGRGKEVVLNKKVLLREGAVLLTSQLMFIIFLFTGILNGIQGALLVLFYLAYLLLLFLITKRKHRQEKPATEALDGKAEAMEASSRPLWWHLLSLDVSHLVLRGKAMNRGRAWALLVLSTAIMTAGTWLLVLGTDLFGEATKIPLIFVAVVLSAAATSLPDTIISMKDARKGNYDDAVSNALGSNIFDIAFALGLPILLFDIFYEKKISLPPEIQDFTQEVWVFLFLATFLALLIMGMGKRFTRLKGYILLLIYGLFLFFVGTQVENELSGIGEPIGDFLTAVADWLGDRIY